MGSENPVLSNKSTGVYTPYGHGVRRTHLLGHCNGICQDKDDKAHRMFSTEGVPDCELGRERGRSRGPQGFLGLE